MNQLTRQTVFSGLVYLGAARAAVVCMNLLATSRLARALGADNFGLYSFAISYVSYFMIAANLGFDTFLMREIAHDNTKLRSLVDSALSIRLPLAVVTAVPLIASAWVIDLPPAGRIVMMIQAVNLFLSVIGLTFVYQGLQRMRVVALREVLGSVLFMLGILFLVHGPNDVVLATWILVLSAMLTNVPILLRYAADFGWPRLRFPTLEDLHLARRSLTYFWSVLMIAVTYNTHIVLIGLLRSDAEVGLFSAGWKIFNFAIIVPNLIAAVFMPRIANLALQLDERSETTDVCMRTIIIIAVPTTIIGAAMVPQIIAVLFGSAFIPASEATLLLLLNGLVVSLNIGFGQPLVAVGRQPAFLRVVGFGAAAGVIINLLLIPQWGITGAAIGTLADEIVILVLFILDRPEVSVYHTVSFATRCLVAVFPAAVVAHYLPNFSYLNGSALAGLVAGGGVGVVVYVLVLRLMSIELISFAAGLRRLH